MKVIHLISKLKQFESRSLYKKFSIYPAKWISAVESQLSIIHLLCGKTILVYGVPLPQNVTSKVLPLHTIFTCMGISSWHDV